jgi:divalent metal cation (Fe/Co/Zn/Cd) transporter
VNGQLRSPALPAGAAHSRVCAAPAAVLLAGSAAGATLGRWWAHPVAALTAGAVCLHAGVNAWTDATEVYRRTT